MLLSRTISCYKLLQLKLFSCTLSNLKSKMTITGTLTTTGSPTLLFIWVTVKNSFHSNLKIG